MTFNVFDAVQQQNEQMRQQELNKQAAKTAALAALPVIRTISKVLAASLNGETIKDPKGTEQRAKALLDTIGEQSLALYEKLGSVNDKRILPSITGSVTTVLQSLYRSNGEAALDVDVASLLAEGAKLPGIWKDEQVGDDLGSLPFRRTIAMMQSMSPLMAAYQRFDFYQHNNRQQVLSDLQNMLWTTVDKSLQSHPVVAQMAEPEVEMLRRNLLLRSGELLAAAWDNQAEIAKAHIAECTTDERRAYKANGYPIDSVVEEFESAYLMLEQSLDTTLSSQYVLPDADENPSPSPA
ncbi:hypothetical protein BTO32_14765 [Marinobacter lutaoensis]|uniref:Uncharacterized protein n=1 Tax=Marinobacter lutaoensis TaxID=135739 RepID=A0A1V2DP94_9GAMM|nr:hypothetical protein [Marinobacter lutaoensis]ONF42473.1 hypothetical protein BTO32_14765 [Marinobacter lutaoensis]